MNKFLFKLIFHNIKLSTSDLKKWKEINFEIKFLEFPKFKWKYNIIEENIFENSIDLGIGKGSEFNIDQEEFELELKEKRLLIAIFCIDNHDNLKKLGKISIELNSFKVEIKDLSINDSFKRKKFNIFENFINNNIIGFIDLSLSIIKIENFEKKVSKNDIIYNQEKINNNQEKTNKNDNIIEDNKSQTNIEIRKINKTIKKEINNLISIKKIALNNYCPPLMYYKTSTVKIDNYKIKNNNIKIFEETEKFFKSPEKKIKKQPLKKSIKIEKSNNDNDQGILDLLINEILKLKNKNLENISKKSILKKSVSFKKEATSIDSKDIISFNISESIKNNLDKKNNFINSSINSKKDKDTIVDESLQSNIESINEKEKSLIETDKPKNKKLIKCYFCKCEENIDNILEHMKKCKKRTKPRKLRHFNSNLKTSLSGEIIESIPEETFKSDFESQSLEKSELKSKKKSEFEDDFEDYEETYK